MVMSPALKKRFVMALSGGALSIAVAVLGGQDGLEGRRYYPYQDIAGVWTVCDGHTGPDIIRNKRYSDTECDQLLARDLAPVEKAVDAAVVVPISQPMRGALYMFTFNVGIGAFRQSALLRALNAGDRAGACDGLRQWIYAGGRTWKGLVNRRDIEHQICVWGGVNGGY